MLPECRAVVKHRTSVGGGVEALGPLWERALSPSRPPIVHFDLEFLIFNTKPVFHSNVALNMSEKGRRNPMQSTSTMSAGIFHINFRTPGSLRIFGSGKDEHGIRWYQKLSEANGFIWTSLMIVSPPFFLDTLLKP